MGTLFYQQRFVWFLILLVSPVIYGAQTTCTGNGQFFGGSVSYMMEEAGGKFVVKIQFNLLQKSPNGHSKMVLFAITHYW